jgi:hypothetical protein
MKKHNEETCEGCISTDGGDVCFTDLREMMDYHDSQRNWFIAKWEDWIYFPLHKKFLNDWWDKIRPGALKHYYQRAKQGYSYQDTWGIDYHLVTILIPMFESLKKDHVGVSLAFFDEKDGVDEDGNPTDEASEKAEQRMQNVYGEIIYGLKCAKLIHGADYNYKKEGEYEKLNTSVKRSFELIGEYFFSLWD